MRKRVRLAAMVKTIFANIRVQVHLVSKSISIRGAAHSSRFGCHPIGGR